LQDVVPEVEKREADLSILTVFKEFVSEDQAQQEGNADGLDESLVRIFTL
jgi:hypothetical protein